MKRNLLLLDIETAPLSDEELLAIIPPFDEAEVKVGNLTDHKKIEAKIEERRLSHFTDYKENAALNPMTGCIVAVGMAGGDWKNVMLDSSETDEADMICSVWDTIQSRMKNDPVSFVLAGWNISDFDLQFLIRRSWRYGVKPPSWLRDGRWWHRSIVDLLDVWKLGQFRKEEGKTVGSSLDNVAKFLGLRPKLGNGKDFAELLKKDPKAAEEYLVRDLLLVEQIADILL